jgi:hypothetical protein
MKNNKMKLSGGSTDWRSDTETMGDIQSNPFVAAELLETSSKKVDGWKPVSM